ncbi:MAG: hypothetical protein GXY77_19570 [Fibrobacter sp.]|nr:hypothetical protein [Fibrobacter sp.]
MKIKPGLLIQTTIVSTLVFMLIDAGVEYTSNKIIGLSFLPFFEEMLNISLGTRFHAVNFLLFSCEMLAVMSLYITLRSLYPSPVKPLVISITIPSSISILILFQTVNLGLYPIKPAILVIISMLTGFPAGILSGAYTYEKIYINN